MSNGKARKAVYVISGSGDRKFWTRIGVAFVNRDESLNVILDAVPVNGELHIRDFVEREPGEVAPPPAENQKKGGRR